MVNGGGERWIPRKVEGKLQLAACLRDEVGWLLVQMKQRKEGTVEVVSVHWSALR